MRAFRWLFLAGVIDLDLPGDAEAITLTAAR